MTGEVEDIVTDKRGTYMVFRKGENARGHVECFFSDPEVIKNIAKDQNLMVLGECGIYKNHVVMGLCSIVSK